MKRQCLAALLAVALGFALATAVPAWAAPSAAPEQILQEAWTAYHIGEYKKTLRLIEPLAVDGNPRAQVMLGQCYENGLGVRQDLAVAAQWYQLAAEQNDSQAQVLLAYCYEVGAGVPQDPRAVVTLMTRAANAGNAEAQFNLALYYSKGLHQTAKDPKESFRWARLAADQGYAQAERFVGACYEHGFGIPENQAEAALWYNKAAAQGLSREGRIFNTVRHYPLP
ncbi:tetratricopeptide repeat protein [Desulfovibrio sp. ZJ200]|uniref:tetratricopeptide repeat protein n=1 Tax=Desulfovibrio sp. ZJ200 TaxID=2709792 RepID=UPI0013EE3D00|nr:tetratricopeptide repeat protein [Desulfovibrio sp. ZJ200]